MPIGTIILFVGLSIPQGWIDGSKSPLSDNVCINMINAARQPMPANVRCIVKVED